MPRPREVSVLIFCSAAFELREKPWRLMLARGLPLSAQQRFSAKILSPGQLQDSKKPQHWQHPEQYPCMDKKTCHLSMQILAAMAGINSMEH